MPIEADGLPLEEEPMPVMEEFPWSCELPTASGSMMS